NPTTASINRASGVWTLDEQGSALVQNAWPLPPNVVQRSLRFNSADSAYLNRSVGTSNRQVFTFSAWVKKGKTPPTSTEYFFSARQAASDNFGISFQTSAVLQIDGAVGGSGFQITTSAVYRDPSAWYHILLAIDTTQGTSANRVRLYVNGTEVTSFSTATSAIILTAT
ncbi:MAG: hypothetical protein EBU08_19940, partial [Micrococcales bacterium]|nr:hypothetical protein [Micrococcales bacterium]